jgi:hypothetical protein
MQHSQRKREVERRIIKRQVGDRRHMKLDIARPREVGASDRKRVGTGVNQVQPGHFRRNQHGPSTAATADVGPNPAALGQQFPRENGKICVKQTAALFVCKLAVTKAAPFKTETGHRGSIKVVRGSLHQTGALLRACATIFHSRRRIMRQTYWNSEM